MCFTAVKPTILARIAALLTAHPEILEGIRSYMSKNEIERDPIDFVMAVLNNTDLHLKMKGETTEPMPHGNLPEGTIAPFDPSICNPIRGNNNILDSVRGYNVIGCFLAMCQYLATGENINLLDMHMASKKKWALAKFINLVWSIWRDIILEVGHMVAEGNTLCAYGFLLVACICMSGEQILVEDGQIYGRITITTLFKAMCIELADAGYCPEETPATGKATKPATAGKGHTRSAPPSTPGKHTLAAAAGMQSATAGKGHTRSAPPAAAPLASKKEPRKQCSYFNRPGGCRNGVSCPFLHEAPEPAAAAASRRVGMETEGDDEVAALFGAPIAAEATKPPAGKTGKPRAPAGKA